MDRPPTDLCVQRFADLDPLVAYRLWALRSRVFVIEQEALYLDLDGRDTEAGTWHLWCADEDGVPVATLRVLDDGEAWRVGRVATDAGHRGRGLAGRLMREVLDRWGSEPVVLDAQTYLEGWYAGFGFVPSGPVFEDEDGMPHVPMRREGRAG
ncbi:GNAT family N-acetyltransferase [Knoellia sp. CPCC 206450]|uniref:GNAT family N-acetyltransferase n=1 Tax=Knoellia tibetensis TaxID=3404798 RepID=UPI003B42813C